MTKSIAIGAGGGLLCIIIIIVVIVIMKRRKGPEEKPVVMVRDIDNARFRKQSLSPLIIGKHAKLLHLNEGSTLCCTAT